MKSKIYPEEVSWEDWKDRPVKRLPISRYLPVCSAEEDADDIAYVEFYKAEDICHKRELIEEFLYEYQQVLKYEQFSYSDFPQSLMGPDYQAWFYWIEAERQQERRISYSEFVAMVEEGRWQDAENKQ